MNKIQRKAIVFLFALFIVSLLPSHTSQASLPSESMLDLFDANSIFYYNPNGNLNCTSFSPGSWNGEEITFKELDQAKNRSERLDLLIKTYGEFALQLQQEYGVPWEVLFAQTVQESEVGTTGMATAAKAKGYYNFLGLVYSSDDILADGGNCAEGAHTHKACYSTLSKMFQAYAISFMHNGLYNAAFAYLNPNNYDLDSFVSTMVKTYAVSWQGYASAVKSIIKNDIDPIRQKYNLPTSEEYAKQNQIPIGGRWPINPSDNKGNKKEIFTNLSNIPASTSTDSTNYCAEGEKCTDDNFTLYSQSDSRWSDSWKGNSSGAGCGPSSFATIATNLLHQKITPKDTEDFLCNTQNVSYCGSASEHTISKELAEHYNLEYKMLQSELTGDINNKINIIDKYLQDGWLIHAVGKGPQPFSNNGHYIVIRGISGDKWKAASNLTDGEYSKTEMMQSMTSLDGIYAIRNRSSSYCESPSGLTNGGFNDIQSASHIGEEYISLKSKTSAQLSSEYGIPAISTPGGSPIYNCVGFSAFFFNKYTDLGVFQGFPNGEEVVGTLSRKFNLPTGSEPKPYSIFSWTSRHTGVVLGINNDTMIIGEASYHNPSHIGICEYKKQGNSWCNTEGPSGSKAFGCINNSQWSFVYLDGHLKGI